MIRNNKVLSCLLIATVVATSVSVAIPKTTNAAITKDGARYSVGASKYLKEITEIGQKRGWSTTGTYLLKNMVNEVYENYDNYKNLNKDYPSKDEYIERTIMKPIRNKLMKITVNNDYGFSDVVVRPYEQSIYFYAVPPMSKPEEYKEYLKEVVHGVIALNQRDYNSAYFEAKGKEFGIKDFHWGSFFLTEGQSVMGQDTISMRLERGNETTNFIQTTDRSEEALFHSCNGYGNNVKEASYYKKFEMLAGSQTMADYATGKITFDVVISTIDNKYGQGTGWKLYKLINNIEKTFILDRANSRFNTTQYNDTVALEKLFIECLVKDANKLKTADDTRRFINMYRFYKNNYMVYFLGKDEKGDFTWSVMEQRVPNMRTLEDVLVKKALDLKVLPDVAKTNPTMNKGIWKSLFYVSYWTIMNNKAECDKFMQPMDLFSTKYSLKYDGKNYTLTLVGKDNIAVDIKFYDTGYVKSMSRVSGAKASYPVFK